MNLPVKHNMNVHDLVNAGSLEMLRAQVTKNIKNNGQLTRTQRNIVIKELTFLVDAERERRQRQIVMQWNDERREYLIRRALRLQEVEDQIKLSRAKTARAVARFYRDAAKCKLEIISEVRKLRPRQNTNHNILRAKQEFQKLRYHELVARRREQFLGQQLEQQVLRRAAFMKKVQKHFPDIAMELLDHYDQLQYQNMSRGGNRR